MPKIVRRGDIFWVELKDRRDGKVLSQRHPGVVVQANIANIDGGVTIVVGTTTYKGDEILPWDVIIKDERCGLLKCLNGKQCKIKCNQIFTVDIENELKSKIGHLSPKDMHGVNVALSKILGFDKSL